MGEKYMDNLQVSRVRQSRLGNMFFTFMYG